MEVHLRALKLCPDLWLAAQVVERVGAGAKYPIETVDQLVAAVAGEGKAKCRFDGAVLTKKNVEEYFPKAFLPIEDEDDLLRKAYAALLWGRSAHCAEQQLAAAKAPA